MRHTYHQLPLRLRLLARLLVGPVGVAIFTGVQLDTYGTTAAVLGAYAVLVTSEAAVLMWDRLRFRVARRRLRTYRASRLP